MFNVLLLKEFREQKRTSRLLVIVAVFLLIGLVSPLLAKYTPQLLSMVPEVPQELLAFLPEPTLVEAVAQYMENMVQFGVLMMILLGMGVMAQEKERGTAAMLLTKPVNRSSMILAKWLALTVSVLGGLILAGAACAAYTALLFEPLPLGEFLVLNFFLALYLMVFLTIAVFASTLARTQAMGAILAFGGMVLLLILNSVPRLGEYMPAKLLPWGQSLVLGADKPAWGSLVAAVLIIVGLLVAACVYFEREEI